MSFRPETGDPTWHTREMHNGLENGYIKRASRRKRPSTPPLDLHPSSPLRRLSLPLRSPEGDLAPPLTTIASTGSENQRNRQHRGDENREHDRTSVTTSCSSPSTSVAHHTTVFCFPSHHCRWKPSSSLFSNTSLLHQSHAPPSAIFRLPLRHLQLQISWQLYSSISFVKTAFHPLLASHFLSPFVFPTSSFGKYLLSFSLQITFLLEDKNGGRKHTAMLGSPSLRLPSLSSHQYDLCVSRCFFSSLLCLPFLLVRLSITHTGYRIYSSFQPIVRFCFPLLSLPSAPFLFKTPCSNVTLTSHFKHSTHLSLML